MGEEEEEIAEVVQKHGWYALSIAEGEDRQPSFLYSIGLMQSCKHPELIMFGQEPSSVHALFSELYRQIRSGRSFAEPCVQTVSMVGVEHRVGFREVHPTQHPVYLGYAMGYCRYLGRMSELKATQAFWPDRSGKFPFEVGCDLSVCELQPRLDLGLTPRESEQFKRKQRI